MSHQQEANVAAALAAYIEKAYALATSYNAVARNSPEYGNAEDEWEEYLRVAEVEGGYDEDDERDQEDLRLHIRTEAAWYAGQAFARALMQGGVR